MLLLARDLQVDSLRALAAFVRLGLEGNSHTVAQCWNAGTLNGSDVNEHILATIIRRNEPIALGRIEKFHGAVLTHRVAFSIQFQIRRLPVRTVQAGFQMSTKGSCA